MRDTTKADRILQRARAATVAFAFATEQRDPNAEPRLPHILGTGFAIEDDRHVVVTAAHVIAEVFAAVSRQTVLTQVKHVPVLMWEAGFEEKKGSGDISVSYAAAQPSNFHIRSDKDIAVVTLPSEAPSLPTAGLTLGSSSDVYEGQRVATCGWPYGTAVHQVADGTLDPPAPSFSWGTISNIKPHPKAPSDAHEEYWIQMPVNPGNSGGAIFDPITGKATGVVVSLLEVRGVRLGLAKSLAIGLARPAIDSYLQSD